jgi:hypothetical protein
MAQGNRRADDMHKPMLYHLMPSPLIGDTLYPLNRLKHLSPDTYRHQVAKYRGRDALLERRIPLLDCLWNDVLHLSPVHPALIRDAKLQAGLTWPAKGRAVGIVDPDRIGMTAENTVIWRNTDTTKTDLRATPEGFSPFRTEDLADLRHLPAPTLRYFAEMKQTGEPTFLFVGIPHVLFLGAIRVDHITVITV